MDLKFLIRKNWWGGVYWFNVQLRDVLKLPGSSRNPWGSTASHHRSRFIALVRKGMNLWLEIKLMRSPCFPVARKRWTKRLLLSRRVKVTSCTECFIPKSFQLDSTCIVCICLYYPSGVPYTLSFKAPPGKFEGTPAYLLPVAAAEEISIARRFCPRRATGARNRVSQTHQLQIHSKVTRGSCWNLLFWWILWWTSNHNSYSIPNCQHFQFECRSNF